MKTADSYIDLLADFLLLRRLPPWHANVGKVIGNLKKGCPLLAARAAIHASPAVSLMPA
ncbi:MAG: hypothetical protein ABI589_05105 [Burkholderiales bacterium]